MAEESFKPDARVAEIALADAEDAVNLAAEHFSVNLDWSEASVQMVEQILGYIYEEAPRANLEEETLWALAKKFGAYIGEVFRRHHGGEWGMVLLGKEWSPGLQCGRGVWCWPWNKAYKRLVNGPEDNVWSCYQLMVQPWPPESQ